MAVVYSLLCIGGRTGKVVTLSIANPAVLSLTSHGLPTGTGVVLATTGALPTGLTAGTTYYMKSTGWNTANLYDTKANAVAGGTTGRITTTGTQSGTHTLKGTYYGSLSAGQLARYGTAGSERIYDSLSAWVTARASAKKTDEEVCEIAEAWSDIVNSLTIGTPAARTRIESKVAGVRTAAFHAGVIGAGYSLENSNAGQYSCYSISASGVTIDGITFYQADGFYGSSLLGVTGALAVLQNNIFKPKSTTCGGAQFYVGASGAVVTNNLVIGGNAAFGINNYVNSLIANNVFTKAGTGVGGGGSNDTITSQFYNNISLGNTTTNWQTGFTALSDANGNAGLTGEAPVTSGNVAIVMATTDFANFAGNDFKPALITSPQVENGGDYYGILPSDLAGSVRPSYSGALYGTDVAAGSFVSGLRYTISAVGTTDFTAIGASASTIGVSFKATGVGAGTGTATLDAVRDIGCFEFDLGYGSWPATHTLTLTNVVVDSSILIRDQADTTTHYSAVAASSTVVIPITVYSDSRDQWRIKVRKGSAAPYFQPFETLMTATAGASSIYVAQISDQ